MKISDEAVEVGSRVFAEVDPFWPDGNWDSCPEDLRESVRGMVAAILEAAAPSLMAQAWDEGRDEGYADAQRGYDLASNPYRKTTNAV